MWKEDLPSGCPFKSTNSIENLLVFRLVKSLNPSDSEFDCHWNNNKHNRGNYQKDPHTHCISKGISVLSSAEAALNALDLPRLRGRFKHVAILELKNDVGALSGFDKTSGHGTLWLYAGVNLRQNIRKIE
jgi:hypothetical protein